MALSSIPWLGYSVSGIDKKEKRIDGRKDKRIDRRVGKRTVMRIEGRTAKKRNLSRDHLIRE